MARFAPRLGLAYRLGDKTVVRAGYGLFYTQAFYPGWGGGMSLDGFNPQTGFQLVSRRISARVLHGCRLPGVQQGQQYQRHGGQRHQRSPIPANLCEPSFQHAAMEHDGRAQIWLKASPALLMSETRAPICRLRCNR